MYLLETEKLFKGSVSLDLGISLYPMKEPSLQSWKYLGLQFLMYSPENKILKKKAIMIRRKVVSKKRVEKMAVLCEGNGSC